MTNKIKINFTYLIIFVGISCPFFSQVLDFKLEKTPAVIPSCAFQDSLGFIWIGTQEGLLKYDGYKTKNYKQIPFDSTSLSSNFINDIEGDKIGNLWIGTSGGGLNYFDQRTEKFTHYLNEPDKQNSLGGNTINKIIVNDDGALWLSIFQNGFTNVKWDRLGNPIYTRYMNNEKIPQQIQFYGLLDMYKDKQGYLWLGTVGFGLERLNIKTGERINYKHDPDDPNSISHNIVSSICEDEFGDLWLGTGFSVFATGGGLNMFDRKTEKFTHYRHNPKNNAGIGSDIITSIFIDSDNILWIGSHNEGIQKISLEELLSNPNAEFNYVEYLRNLNYSPFYEDNQRNIWISINGSFYMRRYDKNKNIFPYATPLKNNPNSLRSYEVASIFVDSKEYVWFGYFKEGLSKFDPLTDKFKHYQHKPGKPNSISENSIISICEDIEGNIWLATKSSGIDILNPNNDTFTHIKENPKDSTALFSNLVHWLLPSKSGNIWVALNTLGLQLFDSNTKEFIRFDNDPITKGNKIVNSLFEDNKGNLWIGTLNSGLYVINLENNQIISTNHFQHDKNNIQSLSNNTVLDIIQSQVYDTTAMWIATNIGLNRLDLKTKTITHISETDGLPSNYILKILEDNDGNLWFTTSVGITKYNPINKKIRNYGKEDGLPTVRFSTGRSNSCKDKDGRIYIAGDGVLVFDPKNIKVNNFIPPIRLTDFKIFHTSVELDTSIQYKKRLVMTYKENTFSFEFAALNFNNALQNQFAYKLDGFHDNWINIGTDRTVSFTNLDPGEYVFKVKGSNNDGVWNEKGTSIKVLILPPWWATWWFRAIALIFLISFGYLIYRYRVNQLLQLERIRVQIASDLHDDVGSSLTKIAIHSEIIQNTKDKNKVTSSSAKIGTMSREIITSLSDIIWSIDARNDKVGDLVDRMRDYLDTVFPAGRVTTNFQTNGLIFENTISQELRQNIYLIFKETVNNAAKYSEASEVKIKMTNGSGIFRLEISDDGKGINLNEKKSGNHGLENMKHRAERIGGEFKIENKNGTQITLIVKEI